ncbi:hypothetical protein ACFE04_004222 [Oxalis oulophora]
MLVLGQAPLPRKLTHSLSKLSNPNNNNPILFNHRRKPIFSNPQKHQSFISLAKSDSGIDSTKQQQPQLLNEEPKLVQVGLKSVPLEGVIQFDKPDFSSRLSKWGRVSLLAGGDVLALLLFSSIGRFSHGFSVFDYETLRTADPFIAGWFLGAYFLGGYSEDGRGMNGFSKAIIAAMKSWVVGIPLGIVIRASTSGHIPPYPFILVTMGSTAVLMVGWRALLFSLLSTDKGKKNDEFRRGNPFELFELLTSLVRRW